jgi:hypothetical protein
MLGYRIAVDGDYGPETRQAVTGFSWTPESSLMALPARRRKRSCL